MKVGKSYSAFLSNEGHPEMSPFCSEHVDSRATPACYCARLILPTNYREGRCNQSMMWAWDWIVITEFQPNYLRSRDVISAELRNEQDNNVARKLFQNRILSVDQIPSVGTLAWQESRAWLSNFHTYLHILDLLDYWYCISILNLGYTYIVLATSDE